MAFFDGDTLLTRANVLVLPSRTSAPFSLIGVIVSR